MEDARSSYFDVVSVGDASKPEKRHDLASSWNDSANKWATAARNLLETDESMAAGIKADTERYIAETILESKRCFALEKALKQELVKAGSEKADNVPASYNELSERVVRAANADLESLPGAEPFALPGEAPVADSVRNPRLPAPTDPWWEKAIVFYRQKAQSEAEETKFCGCLAVVAIIVVCFLCFLFWKGCRFLFRKGCIEKKPVAVWVNCDNCSGSGKVSGGFLWLGKKTCPTCKGEGGWYETK
jgi:hypothetical protein